MRAITDRGLAECSPPSRLTSITLARLNANSLTCSLARCLPAGRQRALRLPGVTVAGPP